MFYLVPAKSKQSMTRDVRLGCWLRATKRRTWDAVMLCESAHIGEEITVNAQLEVGGGMKKIISASLCSAMSLWKGQIKQLLNRLSNGIWAPENWALYIKGPNKDFEQSQIKAECLHSKLIICYTTLTSVCVLVNDLNDHYSFFRLLFNTKSQLDVLMCRSQTCYSHDWPCLIVKADLQVSSFPKCIHLWRWKSITVI